MATKALALPTLSTFAVSTLTDNQCWLVGVLSLFAVENSMTLELDSSRLLLISKAWRVHLSWKSNEVSVVFVLASASHESRVQLCRLLDDIEHVVNLNGASKEWLNAWKAAYGVAFASPVR